MEHSLFHIAAIGWVSIQTRPMQSNTQNERIKTTV